MIRENFSIVEQKDPKVARVLALELRRQQNNLELIASENLVSPEVMATMGSVLTNKYAEGYPGHRYYGGCEYVDMAERICIDRAKEIFNAKFANVQAHSGSQANFCVYLALVKPGDTVMGMDLSTGGHLTHGSKASFSGKLYNTVFYGVNTETGLIDFDEVQKKAEEYKPKMIIAGASAYPRIIDFKRFAEIAHSVGAYLMVDMAHIAGLVAAGEHESPVPYADIVTTTTHKTLRGPRGGMILTNDEELSKKFNKAVFPGTQGGPLEHIIAGKAIALKEAMSEEFKLSSDEEINMLITAGTIGYIVSAKLAPAGAVGGCQAECGLASAMAAAACVYAMKGTTKQIVTAATLALKNILGLTCDPVLGLVEVPCVKRNVFMATYAITAAELALADIESKISPDDVVDAMLQTGQMMSPLLKETSQGGLAATKSAQIFKETIKF